MRRMRRGDIFANGQTQVGINEVVSRKTNDNDRHTVVWYTQNTALGGLSLLALMYKQMVAMLKLGEFVRLVPWDEEET